MKFWEMRLMQKQNYLTPQSPNIWKNDSHQESNAYGITRKKNKRGMKITQEHAEYRNTHLTTYCRCTHFHTCTGAYTNTFSTWQWTNRQLLWLLWQSSSVKSTQRTENSRKTKRKKKFKKMKRCETEKRSEGGRALGEREDGKRSGFVWCTDLPVCDLVQSEIACCVVISWINSISMKPFFCVWCYITWSTCACVCVWERERERERDTQWACVAESAVSPLTISKHMRAHAHTESPPWRDQPEEGWCI